MYLVNESSKLESVSRVYEIGEKSHSLLDHPRIYDYMVTEHCPSNHLLPVTAP